MSRNSRRTYARIGGITVGAGVLFVGGVLIASTPAFADNGPHIMMTNTSLTNNQSGIGGALGGGCASCHRAHSAKATTDLLKTSDEVALCESCHGATGNGATTDVVDGLGYVADANGLRSGTVAGALRGGGFSNASIDSTNATRGPGSYTVANGWRLNKTPNAIGVLATPATTTSSHGAGDDNLTIWGSGAFSASANYGQSGVTLECSSCHDPHGNGNFRILKTVPTTEYLTGSPATMTNNAMTVLPTIASAASSGTTITYTLTTPYPLATGQTVTVAGNTNAEYNVTKATISGVGTADTKTFAVPTFSVVVGTAPAVTTGSNGSVTPVFPDVTTGTQVYTTTNYWKEDPAATPTTVQSPLNAAGNSSFIANVSQWCSTCHTRYLSTSGNTSRTVDSGDALFTYRHTSANGKQDNPNCLQCHVAHGTNATMTGTSASTAANSPQYIDATSGALTGGFESSKLLRVANRGVCQMCHNK